MAGLHLATGGDGLSGELCGGDMLLEALVDCAGVALKAVGTALDLQLRSGTVRVEGDLDFRVTLSVDRTAPSAFRRYACHSSSHRCRPAEAGHASETDREMLCRARDHSLKAEAKLFDFYRDRVKKCCFHLPSLKYGSLPYSGRENLKLSKAKDRPHHHC